MNDENLNKNKNQDEVNAKEKVSIIDSTDSHISMEVGEEIDIDEIMAKYDKESAYRRLGGTQMKIASILAILFSCFQLYTSIFGILPAQLQRSVHLAFVFALVYLLYPASGKSRRDKFGAIDVCLALVGIFVALYITLNFKALLMRAGDQNTLDIIIGLIAVGLVLEGARRVVGLPIAIIASVFLIYAIVGPYMPGFLNHRGYSIGRIVSHMYYTTEGILGIPLGVAATFIFLFILLGAFLEKTGIGAFFIDLANSIAGFAAGGPAKVAVLTSALEGTVSGSSVANTVGSGSFTIPLMKSLGYKPEFAAAVEAAASTGGQIMPPIMGAAAFLMAEFIGIPYSQIAKAAVIPALLYFTGIFISVHLEAKKLGMKGMSKEQLPKLSKVMLDRGYLFIPLVGIVYFLVEGSTPVKAALYGLGLAVATSYIRKSTRLSLKNILAALEQGAKSALGVSMACACAGIIVGTITLTGLGLKLGNGLVSLSGGNLLLTLVFTMITSLILGMGAPTTANYVITSTIAAPAIVQLGVPVLAAHMFTFYFGIIADITPPVALAAFAGSAIAKSNPLKTGIQASKLAIAAFIIPYMFVFNPAILLIDTTPMEIGRMVITSIIGMIGVSTAMEGYLFTHANKFERVAFLIGGLLLIDPGTLTDIIGLVVLVVMFLYQKRKSLIARI
ncbi:MAG: transporter, fusion protein [Sedimentibacter sp.]|jgi:TRAP transporter 4TM/12TM fusion protein|nr:transporter, fusion protein [Sedimentibacter sp.]